MAFRYQADVIVLEFKAAAGSWVIWGDAAICGALTHLITVINREGAGPRPQEK